MRWCLESAVWIAVRSPSIATNAPDQGVQHCVTGGNQSGCARWRQRTNVWRKGTSPARQFRRLTSDRHRGRNSSARRQLERTRYGVSVAGLSPPFGGAG